MNLGTFVHANDSNSTNYFNIINYNKFSSYLDIMHHTQVGDQLHQAHFQMMVIIGVCGVVWVYLLSALLVLGRPRGQLGILDTDNNPIYVTPSMLQ